MNVIRPFGPTIAKVSMSENLVKELNDYVDKTLLDKKKIEELGAGEILLTSIDRDGTKDGYDILLTNEIVHAVGIPVIASGGCGKPEDMIDVFKNTSVNAALAASIFHYETHSVNRVKQMIKDNKIDVRY